jgi:prolyl-tRNA synthetase
VIVRRDTREKAFISLDNLENAVSELMKALADGIYEKALANVKARTYICKSIDEINAALAEKGDGFIKAMWCGSEACEDEVKEKTGAASRCIPFEQEKISETCVCCGKPAKELVIWGRAY